MTFLSDLTARAISFITAFQTALVRSGIAADAKTKRISIFSIPPVDFERTFLDLLHKNGRGQAFDKRISELVWISSKKLDFETSRTYFLKLSLGLTAWLYRNRERGIAAVYARYGGYPTPYQWRIAIEKILYENAAERVFLAKGLEYLPIQIILALGGGSANAHEQRILQMWSTTSDERTALLNASEISVLSRFERMEQKAGITAENLLLDEEALIKHLIKKNAPLSFELVFSEELKEIQRNRDRRENEEFITGLKAPRLQDPAQQREAMRDPFENAKNMGIRALALSGGGIRSATFNLGILQGFASKKLITKFDYLSTVSGGGYIGSWLAAWIKRDQSVVKVTNRLSPQKSPDPTGEELKPVKWLRMFSNYFAPNASIMSVDSWTFGITWLRNTVLNQIVIFLLFLALLFTGKLLKDLWSDYLLHPLRVSGFDVLIWSLVLLTPAAFLAGMGMYAYHKENFRKINVRRKNTNRISSGIILISIIGAFFISAWLSSSYIGAGGPLTSFYEKMEIFAPGAVIGFLCLFLVALLGNYMDCILKFQENKLAAFAILFNVTIVSTFFGWTCLSVVSMILEKMPSVQIGGFLIHREDLQFISGVPLTIEIFSFTVIARMALLGKYFPDERREWWGRIGAHIHRIAFMWILVSTSSLLGRTFLQIAYDKYSTQIIAATGGWFALIAICVKAAFSSKTAGTGEEKGFYPIFLRVLSLTGPYLFILGLLIFLPALTEPIVEIEKMIFKKFGYFPPGSIIEGVIIILLFGIGAYFLARHLGVNEFSMYNFYRNRLVRAYLGGTRRSTERQQTSNPFTGFDMSDDELLHRFSHEYNYHGPYPILNCALNASQGQDLDRQDRKAESFIFSPLFCGFDFSMARSSADKKKSYDYAYRQTKEYAFKNGGPTIGTAMAISGAAVNPNQGYHSSPPTAFLLTVFNVQMGRWLGNPRKGKWQRSDPVSGLGYIISDLVNKSSTKDPFIALSDGGHFDNMGLYEMVRRKCPFIILSDAEQDGSFTCEGLANAIRRCRIDFGAEIKIDISKIIDRTDGRHSRSHYALGEIEYVGENNKGVLLYIKSSITGNEPVDIFEYALKNKTFPHQTTSDQFFDEEQFESYRKLGVYISETILQDKKVSAALKLNFSPQMEKKNPTIHTWSLPFILAQFKKLLR